MDITQLRYFLVTADTLNYTKAAERLFMSRQALRQALALMEEEVGMPLFVNERNKLSLTVQGEYLQLSARKVVEEFEKMMVDVRQFAQEKTFLRVGLSVSLFPFMIPELQEILNRFQQRYPQIRLENQMLSNDEVIDAVSAGTVDCGAVIQMKCQRKNVKMQRLEAYPAIMSMGKKHSLLHGKQITLDDLQQYQCIGMGSLEKTMMPLYEDCQRKGYDLRYEIVPDTIETFYRVTHDDKMAFDIMMDQEPVIGNVYDCVLEGYSWELGILYQENSLEKKEIQLLYRFIEEEYRRLQMRKQEG